MQDELLWRGDRRDRIHLQEAEPADDVEHVRWRCRRAPAHGRRCAAPGAGSPGERSRATSHEDVLTAVVSARASVEVAVERLDLQARDVDEPEPLVPGRPPQRAATAVVETDVDAVGTDGVPDRVRKGRVLVPAVQAGGDPMIQRERVPRESSARSKRGGDPLEASGAGRPTSAGAAARGTGNRSAPPARRARDRACHPRAGRARPRPRPCAHVPAPASRATESIPRTRLPGRPRDRNRHTSVPDRELDERPVGLARQLDVERDVSRHPADHSS